MAWNAVLRVRNDTWQRRRTPLSRGRASGLAEQLRTLTPLVRERQAKALETLRAKLSLEDQSLLALRVDQGLSWAEVAEIVATDGEPVKVDALLWVNIQPRDGAGLPAEARSLAVGWDSWRRPQ